MAVASKVEENAEELAPLLTAEQGKPLNGLGSRWEIGGAVAWPGYGEPFPAGEGPSGQRTGQGRTSP